MKGGAACLLLTLALTVAAGPSQAAEDPDREIQYLLTFVAGSGCVFNRNGTAHDAHGAADHLRLKYDRGKRYAGSAEQFIDRLASKSSWSGETYTVDCNGQVETSSAWLHRALADYRLSDDPVESGEAAP